MNRDLRRARLAAMAVLFCNGMLYSTWGVYIPAIKQKFALSDGLLAIAMVAVATGGIVTLARAGDWILRTGSGRASVRSGILMAASTAVVPAIPSYAVLVPFLFIYGIATAANDVAANSQGAYIEARSQRSIFGSLHGSFSAGGLVGATLASAWTGATLAPLFNFAMVSAASCVAMIGASHFLMNEPSQAGSSRSTQEHDEIASGNVDQRQVTMRLFAFGALAFAGLVVEGAIYDWAAVYMREVVKAAPSWTGLGYAAFAIGMAAGRVSGDWVRDRVAHRTVIVLSCGICVTGLTITLALPTAGLATAGFLLSGVGLSNVIPIMFSSAGKLSTTTGLPPSRGLALTTRIAYVGLLAGPLAIGPLAEVFGLKLALIVLTFSVFAIGCGWVVLSYLSGGVPWEIRRPNPV
ncbi:MFS transporter [Paraburkholderia phenoliruptrix]|uniref:MFS transporter n=1 Tax=Paraburkholderia phenoliruptrix TaxID=252970 RepID=UPI002869B568|nr:MFS transporter [Paraburkholderia phenoliruptrix]WMY09590.1 MFS transporter [Paraburkholderia phenoliruptrix]